MFRYLFLTCVFISVNCKIINTDVVQIIDIRSQLVKIDAVISFLNLHSTYIDCYDFTLDPDVNDHFIKFRSVKDVELPFERNHKKPGIHYTVRLDWHLPQNDTYRVKVELVLLNKITPLEKRLPYHPKNYIVLYRGNLNFYSPYNTMMLRQNYLVKDGNKLKISHKPFNQTGDLVTYIFKNVEPFTFVPLKMIFVITKNIFYVVTDLRRTIDISHYGKIYIQDEINIINNGSLLVGPYQPEYQMKLDIKHWWYTYLPASAEAVQYYDELGYIRSYKVTQRTTCKASKFQHRYPLLGGWKGFYVVRYWVPTYEYLFHNNKDFFKLRIRAIDHIMNDIIIRQATVIVLFPAGSQILTTLIPRGFRDLEYIKDFTTSLYSAGRPAITFKGSNLLENHIDNIMVGYSYSIWNFLYVPLMVAFVLMCGFLTISCVFRLNFVIDKVTYVMFLL